MINVTKTAMRADMYGYRVAKILFDGAWLFIFLEGGRTCDTLSCGEGFKTKGPYSKPSHVPLSQK